MGIKEHKIHYAQHSHLETVPVVSYHKNQFALSMLFKWMFRVSQSKMLSLNISVTTLLMGKKLLSMVWTSLIK